MPGTRDAEYIVGRVRDLIQSFNQTPYRDGFPDDPEFAVNAKATPILNWVNQAMQDLEDTQYRECQFVYGLNTGQTSYTLDERIHEIRHVTLFGQPLKRTSMLGLDTNDPGWQNTPDNAPPGGPPNTVAFTTPGVPIYYYTVANQIGFYPQPDQPYEIILQGTSTTPDLVERTDVPLGLPTRFQAALWIGAAAYISLMDVENDVSIKRSQTLAVMFKSLHDDLQTVIAARGWDTDEQISPQDYRYYFRRGADG